jgi:hypothetical protein
VSIALKDVLHFLQPCHQDKFYWWLAIPYPCCTSPVYKLPQSFMPCITSKDQQSETAC